MSADDDLDRFNRDDLVAEVRRLHEGIRAHRDSSGHDLCWHHPQLWNLLPEGIEPEVAVPRGHVTCAAVWPTVNHSITSCPTPQSMTGSSKRKRRDAR